MNPFTDLQTFVVLYLWLCFFSIALIFLTFHFSIKTWYYMQLLKMWERLIDNCIWKLLEFC